VGHATRKNAPPVAIGQILAGKYRVLRIIGRGGMGTVVEAENLTLQDHVAIKVMHPELATDPALAQRFLREARTAASLRSEHIARVHDCGALESGLLYIVMDMLEGCDLKAYLERGNPLPVADAVQYIAQAATALAEAHAAGVVHRDLKPGNLFLTWTPSGRPCVKVLDFGVAKILGDQQHVTALTQTTTVLGSPWYISPEQLRSAKTTDARADIWSLGVCLYQCLTKRVPFESQAGIGELGAKILTAPPTPITNHRQDLPPPLVAIIMRCLEKDRERRFANGAELQAALESVAREFALAPSPRPADSARPIPRNREAASSVIVESSGISRITPDVPDDATISNADFARLQDVDEARWPTATLVGAVSIGLSVGFLLGALTAYVILRG
jgi:eukaryotic-like serine/threonine-protein kinase